MPSKCRNTLLPLAVTGAVALVGDDEIEVTGREVAVLGDHGLQGGDGDALGAVEAAAWAQHVAGVVAQVVSEGVFGLAGQRNAIHEEEDSGDGPCFEQALDEGGGGARLAGAGGHFDEEVAAAKGDLGA